ncbi:hypothetical protein CLAIMM_09981 [Cladophialophora immunda]|nr:hypothetical protein CLAIMM_09981 [Cladophialophora immunda]
MALIWTWAPVTVLLLGLGLVSVPSPVVGAPILHKHHKHGHFHTNVVPEGDPWLAGTSSTGFADPTAVPRALANDGTPSGDTSTTRFVNYPLETPYLSNPLRVEEEREEDEVEEAPTVAFESIVDRTRPLTRSSGGGIPPQPYPPNGPAQVGAGLFERLASRTRPLVRSSGGGGNIPPQPYPPNKALYHHPGVSDSAAVFFLAAVGFFFVSLVWNLYVRHGWARDQAKQTDVGAVGAMRLGSLVGEGRGRSRGKHRRSPGGWLRAANATPAPVAAV